MSTEDRVALRNRLYVVAVQLQTDVGGWADEAIELAVALIVAGDDGPATLAVASLSPGSTSRDAEALVREMLAEHGVPTSSESSTEDERLAVVFRAFAHGGLSVPYLASQFYGSVPTWAKQDEFQRGLLILLDQWETEQSPPAREPITAAMRRHVEQSFG